METKAFENAKNQIGRCGIWCGSCAVGNGTLRDLAKRSEHLIGGYGVDEWGAKDFDGKEFMKGLKSIQNLPHMCGMPERRRQRHMQNQTMRYEQKTIRLH